MQGLSVKKSKTKPVHITLDMLFLSPFIILIAYYLVDGNGNGWQDGEVANSTDGSPKVFRSEVALGRLRTDGAVSIDGPYGKTGNLTTKPLVFNGKNLYLNCDASGGGAITISIHSAQTGELLLGPSAPIVHSSVRAKVEWRRQSEVVVSTAGTGAGAGGGSGSGGGGRPILSLEQLAGTAALLTIAIEEAELYSFQFAEE